MDPYHYMRTLYIYDFAKKKHQKVLSDQRHGAGLHWSPDNRSLYTTLGGSLYRLDLVPRDELADEKDHWYDIFNPKRRRKTRTKTKMRIKRTKKRKTRP